MIPHFARLYLQRPTWTRNRFRGFQIGHCSSRPRGKKLRPYLCFWCGRETVYTGPFSRWNHDSIGHLVVHLKMGLRLICVVYLSVPTNLCLRYRATYIIYGRLPLNIPWLGFYDVTQLNYCRSGKKRACHDVEKREAS